MGGRWYGRTEEQDGRIDREEDERGNGNELYDGILSLLRLYTHGGGEWVLG
jgi:hypothetical protein